MGDQTFPHKCIILCLLFFNTPASAIISGIVSFSSFYSE
ncbi:hypothetical protein D083_1832 [Dickeya solani RNS 08.23.3.1.A]|nr:hypothetical protein D083_1832 [Dickeya solani RNS 08.23.3.1.A]